MFDNNLSENKEEISHWQEASPSILNILKILKKQGGLEN